VDVLSAIEFDDTGDYIAVGDRGGRIVLFERDEKSDKVPSVALLISPYSQTLIIEELKGQ
jgi:hypothetical protein